MATNNFNTSNQTLRQLLENGLTYRVPHFQRDYIQRDYIESGFDVKNNRRRKEQLQSSYGRIDFGS